MASPSKSLSKSKPKSKSKSKKSKHRIKHIGIDLADNGGSVATHHYHPEDSDEGDEASMTPPSSTHAFSNPDDLLAHLSEATGGQMPQASAAGPGPSAGPSPAGAAPQGGM